jgi:NADPH:quinone reductase-like Zn-dependent oxidoreductase
VKIHATTVTAGDCEMRRLELPLFFSTPMRIYNGLQAPKRITILGQELAGEIESVGKSVRLFKPGDQVFATTGFNLGGYAEYICLAEKDQESALALKPANMSYEEAAAVPFGGLESLHFLRQAHIQEGQKVLINGAGGSIGTFGIQISKHFGAEITAVDSADKLEMLRWIGADHTIDYRKEDFTKRGEKFDVVFDVIGKSPFSGSIHSLEEGGYYLLANPRVNYMLRGAWVSMRSTMKVISGTAQQKSEDLNYLRQLAEDGVIRTIIDRTYPLEETAEAHRYVETGAKKGNLIITVS